MNPSLKARSFENRDAGPLKEKLRPAARRPFRNPKIGEEAFTLIVSASQEESGGNLTGLRIR
ncbi:MAG TPA: hypothetical protein VF791_14710 [Pyrinomonadaceae bacterium]